MSTGNMLPGKGRSAAPAAPALPCQNNTNSINPPSKVSEEPWNTHYRRKKKYSVRIDAEGFVAQWGEDNVGEFTMTFADEVTDKKEASRRWNSFRNKLEPLGIVSYMGCWELQEKRGDGGVWHLHLLTALRFPIRNQPGSRSNLQRLRDQVCGSKEQEHLDGLLMRHGFGYIHHIDHLRKTAKEYASYFSKYITKSYEKLGKNQKRIRLLTYARNVRRSASVNFAWNGPAAINYRRKLAIYCGLRGCTTLEEMKERYGSKWQYKFRQLIQAIKLTTYDSPLCDVAENFRLIPWEEAFFMGHEAFEYWQRLRLKHGLDVTTIETNPDGSKMRNRKDRK